MLVTRRHAALLALVPAATSAGLLATPASAATSPPESFPGTYALPDGQPAVAATLTTNRVARILLRDLDIAMTELGTGRPVASFETELTKQLHVIAVSGDFRTFLHEHGERPDAPGHFRVPMNFPRDGGWHVFADAVPAGMGQQVFRFDLALGGAAIPTRRSPPELRPNGLQAASGRYAARFDSLDLRAGQDTELRLRILRDGGPAPDLTPYLGVAAHAVLIGVADLSYVHVHAAPADAPAAGGTGAPMRHDAAGMPGMGPGPGAGPGAAGVPMPPTGHGHDHAAGHAPAGAGQGAHGAGHAGTMGATAPLQTGAAVPPDLLLHIRAPKAGTYALWLQFTAGGQVRTVPFVVAVA